MNGILLIPNTVLLFSKSDSEDFYNVTKDLLQRNAIILKSAIGSGSTQAIKLTSSEKEGHSRGEVQFQILIKDKTNLFSFLINLHG